MSTQKPHFRPDIEGLRGAAILLVVLFHAGVQGVSGGFVGVDVFFVLSGYFITGILARELAENGTIDLTAFYGTRSLRLLPALLVVLLATLAGAMFLYAPIDRATIAENAQAVALYSGNIEFARGEVNYFSSGENPLLHTWSLAVEQQFYFVWPLFLLVVALIFGRKFSAAPDDLEGRPSKQLVLGVIVAGIASFGASLWLTTHSQPWAFFGMPTRIWEFALGGAIALRMRASERESRLSFVQVAGVAAIAFAVVAYDRSTPYPGIAAVVPALGAAALIAGGHWAPTSLVSRLLSARWLRWLGTLSYAWYLWHWPLVGLGGVLYPQIGVWGKQAWSGAGLALAWLTYRLVEQPSRSGRLSRMSPVGLSLSAAAASLVAAFIAHGAMRAAERRVEQPDQKRFAAARNDRMEHDCWVTTVDEPRGACEFGDTRSSTAVVLFGDSHAEHWLGALDRIGKERGWKIIALVKGGCPVADMPEAGNARRERYYRECIRHREATVRKIIAMRPAAAILSSWDHYLPTDGKASDWQVTPEAWYRGLRRTYERVSHAGIPTIAIRGTPRTWFNVPGCLSRRAAKLPFAAPCEYDRAQSLSMAASRAQSDAARGLNMRIVNMNDQVCGAERCGVERNGVIVFTDDNHLTASFSRSVAPVLSSRLDVAMAELGQHLP
ncbi:MAG: acyltransferase family protein [Gemmatimonadota bacterium]